MRRRDPRAAGALVVAMTLAACGSSSSNGVSLPSATAPPDTVAPTTAAPATTAAPTTTEAPTTTTPPPAPGELVTSGVLLGRGTFLVAGTWIIKFEQFPDGYLYQSYDMASGATQEVVYQDGELPFTELDSVGATTNADGSGTFVIVGKNITPQNGLTPESTEMFVIGLDPADPTVSSMRWIEQFPEASVGTACGYVLSNPFDQEVTEVRDGMSGDVIATIPFARLDRVFCHGSQMVADGIWVDVPTGSTVDLSDLTIYDADGPYALGDNDIVDMSTGAVIYTADSDWMSNPGVSVDAATNTAIVYSGDLAGIDLATGAERWRLDSSVVLDAGFQIFRVSDGIIYGTVGNTLGDDAQLVALDAMTGEQLWAGGTWATYDGSDSRSVISMVQVAGKVALDFGPDNGVWVYEGGARLLGVDGGVPVWE